jgi:sulfate adenylyltransferase large subunit
MAEALEEVTAHAAFNVEQYLLEERTKDLFRFSTAGSVDDGKSTLIGRLLYDTQSVYDDQVRAIEGKGTTAPGVLDLALLTDGLRAEREQGITIDVAYRYFATSRRKFIIADTPGHEQYTRNMATGASTADAAIVLVDARKGVLRQSRRHAYIAALLGVRHILVAVNKMDLVEWSERAFVTAREEFLRFFAAIEARAHLQAQLHFVPVSALAGDNVVHASAHMPWYAGATLLNLLESLPSAQREGTAPLRFAVQRVVRPDLDFRGYAGQIAAGTVRPGDRVVALPSGQSSRVKRIVTFDGDLAEASAPRSVTLTLDDEIDISRGDLLAETTGRPRTATRFEASLVWMDAQPLDLHRRYLLKHTSRTVSAHVRELLQSVDLGLLEGGDATEHTREDPAFELALNGIALVSVETSLPLYADTYRENRHTGSFILIDAETNATVAAGMIRSIRDSAAETDRTSAVPASAVSAAERVKAWGHTGAQLVFRGDAAIAAAVERALFVQGAFVVRVGEKAAALFADAGALAIVFAGGDRSGVTVNTAAGSEWFELPRETAEAVEATLRLLRGSGIVRERGRA